MRILLRLSLFFFVIAALQSCQYTEVHIDDIRNFEIEKVEEKRIYFSFDARVINPNKYALKVSSTDLRCEINGVNMGQLYLSDKVKVPADNDEYVPVNASVTTEGAAQNVLSILLGSLFSQAVDIRLKGEVKGGLLFFPKKIRIDHSERVEWSGSYR